MCMFHNPFKVVPLHLVKYFQKTKKVSIFSWRCIWSKNWFSARHRHLIVLYILQTTLIKDALFQHMSFKSILTFKFNHHYKWMHSIKWMMQKLDLYWFEYVLFRIITRFRLLFWRLCKLSSCINPVLDPYFFIEGIKKTQSVRYFYQINCDKILNNSNKMYFWG